MIYDGIMGLIVADALGVPYEFKKRDSFHATEMKGFGTYNQPPGTWSDDSSMTLATIDSITQCKGSINPGHIMECFVAWLNNAKYTPYGKVFDVGNTTSKAIHNYCLSGRWNFKTGGCGCSNAMDNGNGSLMRILPLTFIDSVHDDIIDVVSGLTHAHPISMLACEIYICIAKSLYGHLTPDEAYDRAVHFMKCGFFNHPVTSEFYRLYDLKDLTRDDIISSGFVITTLEAALWCLLHTNNYADCVLTAVNLGDDADTIAAIAGGLAGITYGAKSIPQTWIDSIARKDWIEQLCTDFEQVIKKG